MPFTIPTFERGVTHISGSGREERWGRAGVPCEVRARRDRGGAGFRATAPSVRRIPPDRVKSAPNSGLLRPSRRRIRGYCVTHYAVGANPAQSRRGPVRAARPRHATRKASEKDNGARRRRPAPPILLGAVVILALLATIAWRRRYSHRSRRCHPSWAGVLRGAGRRAGSTRPGRLRCASRPRPSAPPRPRPLGLCAGDIACERPRRQRPTGRGSRC